MKANNENTFIDFELNLKNADSEFDLAQDKADMHIFDQSHPEGSYELCLETQYDQFVLQGLLTMAFELADASKESATPFE